MRPIRMIFILSYQIIILVSSNNKQNIVVLMLRTIFRPKNLTRPLQNIKKSLDIRILSKWNMYTKWLVYLKLWYSCRCIFRPNNMIVSSGLSSIEAMRQLPHKFFLTYIRWMLHTISLHVFKIFYLFFYKAIFLLLCFILFNFL